MLHLSINGEQDEWKTTQQYILLSDIVKKHNPENNTVAVAVNGNFIPRSQYLTTQIQNNDNIDIVSPVGGG